MGEFYNPIFVLTDKINSTKLDEYDVTLVDITEHKPKFETTSASEAWENSSITKVKWFKTQLFHLIPAEEDQSVYKKHPKNTKSSTPVQKLQINSVLYIDADEIINAPMYQFEKDVTQTIRSNEQSSIFTQSFSSIKEKCTAYFFPERFYISQSVNSGTALYFRKDSQELLSEWSREILSGKYERDQSALDATLQRTRLKVCTFPTQHNFFSADFVTTLWNILSFGRRRRGATFIHPCSSKDTKQMAIPYDRNVISNHRL